MWPMGLFFKCVSLYYIIAYRLSVKWFQHLVLKVISSVKQDRRQVPEMRYQRFFFLLCWKTWDKPKNANYSEMTIHHHKFYGIDKQNGMRLKIAITIILDVSFIILNSFWYKSVNETLNIKAAVRGLKMPPLFWSTCEEAGKPLICWYLSSVEYSWFTVIWSEFYRSWNKIKAGPW